MCCGCLKVSRPFGKGGVDVSEGAIEMYLLRHAKPFRMRFVSRNKERFGIVLRAGKEAHGQ